MARYDVVVIGGSAGGITAALTAKATYPEKSVILVRKENKVLVPCGIPYVLASLESVEQNLIPDALLTQSGIEVLVATVTEVRPSEHRLVLENGQQLEYERLILATGSQPVVPPIDGIEKDGVLFIKKDYDYLTQTRNRLLSSDNVVIIGGGFIGVEVADELLKLGKKVALIEKNNWLLPTALDKEFGEQVHDLLTMHGAKVMLGVDVEAITGAQRAEGVRLATGEELEADAVVVSVGYRPNLDLAEKMGLATHPRFGVIVDEYMRTSERDVFAVGDCTAKRNFLTGDYSPLMLASTAAHQGRIAGMNLFGIKTIKEFVGSVSAFSTEVNGVAFASVGLGEERARQLGMEYVVGRAETVDKHPGKLPGAMKQSVKLTFAKRSGVLVGAQLSGGKSVGELVNEVAVMVQKRMTLEEILALQFSTHPMLSASPIAYPVVNAALNALKSSN